MIGKSRFLGRRKKGGSRAMDPNKAIGARIKLLRTGKQYTLKQVSEETGLSMGFLSQVERGISSVAIDSLAKIASCLGASLSSFFDEVSAVNMDPVVHDFEQKFTPVNDQMYQATLSHDVMRYNFLPRVFLLMPSAGGEESEPEVYTHFGEEFLYVLEGVVTVFCNGARHVLYPGNSMQIDSSLPHNWANETNKPAKMLYINYPNPFLSKTAADYV